MNVINEYWWSEIQWFSPWFECWFVHLHVCVSVFEFGCFASNFIWIVKERYLVNIDISGVLTTNYFSTFFCYMIICIIPFVCGFFCSFICPSCYCYNYIVIIVCKSKYIYIYSTCSFLKTLTGSKFTYWLPIVLNSTFA